MDGPHHYQTDKFIQKSKKIFQSEYKLTKNSQRYLFIIGVIIVALFFLIVAILLFNQQSQIAKKRILSEKSQSMVAFLGYLLNLVSSMANTLKIMFQLTALLFVITDLVNFWNLASIYIFLPIQIPHFAREILQNVWTQFNLPILSFFNLSFDTITFKQKTGNYLPEEQYLEALELDVSQIAFEPMFVLVITGIQLIIMTMVLRWIKKSFRKLRDHVSKGIKLEDAYMKILPLQINGSEGQKVFEFLKSIISNSKIIPLDRSKSQQKDIQQPKKVEENANLYMQQSMKKIVDNEISSIITQHIEIEPRKFQNVSDVGKLKVNQHQLHPQLKFMFMIHKMAQNKIKQSGRIKSEKHWSQTISINQFQILSALLMSFMPVIFLPLYSILKKMQYSNLMEKANDLIYLLIISVLFIYPFVYLTAKLNQSRRRKQMKKNHGQSRKQALLKNQVKKKSKKGRNLTQIKLKEQVFQTFYMFFMNIIIPFTVAIRSSPVIFLSLNLTVHVLLVASSLIFYRKKSCKGKFSKYNKTIQLFTFLLYHLCFCFVHIFNQIKESLLKSHYLTQDTVNSVDKLMGVMIIGIFAIGGFHQMLEFLIKIVYTVFKLIYMMLHVICGGYDIKQLEEDMIKYTKARPLNNIQSKIPLFNNELKNTIMVRELKEEVPKNTERSLSQLGIDLQIQIVKNEMIVNKMKLQFIQQRQRLHEYDQQQLEDLEYINFQSLTINPNSGFSSQSQEKRVNREKTLGQKIASNFNNQIILSNKENAMAVTFPIKKIDRSRNRNQKSHLKLKNQIQVKKTQF